MSDQPPPDPDSAAARSRSGAAQSSASQPAGTTGRTPRAKYFEPIGLAATPLRSLVRREPLGVHASTPIRSAAALMREHQISSLLIQDEGGIRAIVTDRDLRNRVVAEALPTDRPIVEVATLDPITLQAHQTAFDALLLMTRHGVHHVPILENGRAVGMLTTTDLTEHQASSAAVLAQQIGEQRDVPGLQQACAKLGELQHDLVSAGAGARATGQLITAITDLLTTKLIEIAQRRFGEAPVPFAWVAAGSQARSEQTAGSDQDNCLVLDDSYDTQRHGEYFRQFAQFVCAGLDACGYVFCPGFMMAQTDTWRQPLQTWKNYFHGWIGKPDPTALMHTCVFFDLRHIDGESALVEELREDFLTRSRGNSIFLTHMVGNALSHRPPLNWFGRIAPARSGEYRGRIDIKHQGVGPIIDLARVYALAAGNRAVGSHDRLGVAAQGGEISAGSARDLSDALELIATQRVRHQVRMADGGLRPNNQLALSELSNFERTLLRDAFLVVKNQQEVLGLQYPSSWN